MMERKYSPTDQGRAKARRKRNGLSPGNPGNIYGYHPYPVSTAERRYNFFVQEKNPKESLFENDEFYIAAMYARMALLPAWKEWIESRLNGMLFLVAER